jgi:hypothetical protein
MAMAASERRRGRRDQWVEVWFAGEVRDETVALFFDRVGEYARRFGLSLEGGGATADDYPGTSAVLDRAVSILAEQRGVSVKQVHDELADEVRGAAVR